LEGVGNGRTVRVRHGAIARRAAAISFAARPTDPFFFDKARVFERLSSATVRVVPEFWHSSAASPLLGLSVALRKTDAEVAVAVAEGAVDGEPENVHLRSRLCQTLREVETPDPASAEGTCREFFNRYPHKLTAESIRHLILEWAVASGECKEFSDHGARNVWLALLSFSDQAGGQIMPMKHARHLPAVTMGLSLTVSALDDGLVARAAGAVLTVGSVIPGTSHLTNARTLAGEAADNISLSELGTTLAALADAVWDLLDESFREQKFLPADGALTFSALTRAVAEASLV
jgi:hypothetical protein